MSYKYRAVGTGWARGATAPLRLLKFHQNCLKIEVSAKIPVLCPPHWVFHQTKRQVPTVLKYGCHQLSGLISPSMLIHLYSYIRHTIILGHTRGNWGQKLVLHILPPTIRHEFWKVSPSRNIDWTFETQ